MYKWYTISVRILTFEILAPVKQHGSYVVQAKFYFKKKGFYVVVVLRINMLISLAGKSRLAVCMVMMSAGTFLYGLLLAKIS